MNTNFYSSATISVECFLYFYHRLLLRCQIHRGLENIEERSNLSAAINDDDLVVCGVHRYSVLLSQPKSAVSVAVY